MNFQELSEKIRTTKHKVRFSDGDPAGIVYFSNIPMYFDESFIELSKIEGFDWGQRDMQFIIPIVEQKATYRRPLKVGQEFYVATAVIHKGNRSFKCGHVIYIEDGREFLPIAFGYITRAVVNTGTFKAMQMPESLDNSLSKYVVEDETWSNVLEQL